MGRETTPEVVAVVEVGTDNNHMQEKTHETSDDETEEWKWEGASNERLAMEKKNRPSLAKVQQQQEW